MKPTLAAVFVVLFVAACSSPRSRIHPELEIIDIPALDTLEQAELGDTVVSKGKIYTYDGIELFNQVSYGDGVVLKKLTVEPGDLVAREEDTTWTYYFSGPTGFKNYEALLGETYRPGGLKIAKNNTEKIAIFQKGLITSPSPNPAPEYVEKKVYAVDKPTFRQELIYNGVSGNSVKFLYRELSNDRMRPAFTQEVQYDLGKDTVVGFKGVRIKILEATNTQLKYKVLKSFPDSL